MTVDLPRPDSGACCPSTEGPVFPSYQGLEKCTWSVDPSPELLASCPHIFRPAAGGPEVRPDVAHSVLELIGNTPCVELARLCGNQLDGELAKRVWVVGKCEFFNAGGSVKDRIGLRMVEEAEREGRISPLTTTLIEPTSGNTGIGISLAAAIKGYRVVVTMPEKMSGEKVNMMKCLGAEIRRTPTEKAWNDVDSHIGLALRLEKQIPGGYILDQYKNPYNPIAHYDGTAEELVRQVQGSLDVVFIGAGTGGTLTGIARKIKEKMKNCRVVAIDPCGSILAQPEELNDYKRLKPNLVEGIGYDFVPTVLDRGVVDEWVKVDDQEAFQAARAVIRTEGLMVGGSAGSAIAGMFKWLNDHRDTIIAEGEDKKFRCAVILPDSSRNYMSKFLDDDWLIDHDFMDAGGPSDLIRKAAVKEVLTVDEDWTLDRVRAWFAKDHVQEEEVVVVDKAGRFKGIMTRQLLVKVLSSPGGDAGPRIGSVELKRRGKKVEMDKATEGRVKKALEIHGNVFLVDDVKEEIVAKWKGRVSRHSYINF